MSLNPTEIVITSDASGASWTCCAWDPRAGTNIQPYRAGGSVAAAAHSIAQLNGRHIIAGNATKPLLHVWPVNSQEQCAGVRLVVPGYCTALDATADGKFLIAGIGEKKSADTNPELCTPKGVYVWQLGSGRLLAVLARHFQAVTSVRCTSDGSHFVTAGRDGKVFVWNMLTVVAGGGQQNGTGSSSGQPEPLYEFADHTLPVTDVHVSRDAMRGHMATVSEDRSVKLYDLASGQQLLSVVFDAPLTAVTVDPLDGWLYVGSATGAIHSFALDAPPRQREFHVTSAADAMADGGDALTMSRFVGHTAAVTALSVSLDGESLLSGGRDGNAMVWDVTSGQLVRTLQHKAAVTNAFYALAPAVMFDAEQRLPLISGNLQKMVATGGGDEDAGQVVEVLVDGAGMDGEWSDAEEQCDGDVMADVWRLVREESAAVGGADGLVGVRADKGRKSVNGNRKTLEATNGVAAETMADELERLRAENKALKLKNKELYQFRVKQVLNK